MNRFDIEMPIMVCSLIIFVYIFITRYKKVKSKVENKQEQKKYVINLYTGVFLFSLAIIFAFIGYLGCSGINNIYIAMITIIIMGLGSVFCGYAGQIYVKDLICQNKIEFAYKIKKEKLRYKILYVCGIYFILMGIMTAIIIKNGG